MEMLPSTTRRLHTIAAAAQRDGRVPGLAAGVARDGELAWFGGYGAADLDRPDEAPDADTQYQVASNTKTFVAVVVMALRDEGLLDLDAPLADVIPESTQGGVTIRQLLSHSSGMQREPVGDVFDTLAFPTRDELVPGWNAAERVGRAHTRFHYSNLGFSLLGEVIARLDGGDWWESVQRRILRPLEMTRTTLGPDGRQAGRYFVPPYTDVPLLEPVLEFGAIAPAGGMASTATDLARWGGFVADPSDEILSPDTLEEMCQPQIVSDVRGWSEAWGLGFLLARRGERTYVGHTGGWPGSITGVFTHRESATTGLVLMNNSASPSPLSIAVDLADHVVTHEPAAIEPWRPGTPVPAELTSVLGVWFSEGTQFVFSVREGTLEARTAGQPRATPPAAFERIEADLYRTTSGRERGELLRLTRDEEGVVVRLHWATYLFTREPLAFGGHLE